MPDYDMETWDEIVRRFRTIGPTPDVDAQRAARYFAQRRTILVLLRSGMTPEDIRKKYQTEWSVSDIREAYFRFVEGS